MIVTDCLIYGMFKLIAHVLLDRTRSGHVRPDLNAQDSWSHKESGRTRHPQSHKITGPHKLLCYLTVGPGIYWAGLASIVQGFTDRTSHL